MARAPRRHPIAPKADWTRFYRDAFPAYGVPAPEVEYPASHDRRWRLDYAWPAQRVALEVEGGYWTGQGHSRAKRAAEDRQKHNALAVAGWIVLRCDPEELKAMSIVPTLALALETRAARSERGR